MNRYKAAFAAIFASLLGFAPAHSADDFHRIALIPVVVHSSEDPGYLREGLRDMLVSRLEQGGVVQAVLIDDPNQATTNLAKALETGREAGADFVLFGSFTRFGQGASLDMQCAATQGVDGRPPLRQIFVHSGDIAAMIPDLDDLVGKVARFISEFARTGLASGPQGLGATGDSLGSLRGLPAGDVSTLELLERVKALEEAVRALRETP